MTLVTVRTRTAQVRDVTPGPLTVTDTCIMYHLTNFNASRNVILHMRYVSTCGSAGCGGGRENNEQKLSHVNKAQPIRVKMILIAAIRVTCI
jgi:hypothetical protein